VPQVVGPLPDGIDILVPDPDTGGSWKTLLLVAVKAMNSPKSREKTSYKKS
jgi:hypothetical protein